MKQAPKTLKTTVKYCLQMWRDIALVVKLVDKPLNTSELKDRWLELNGFEGILYCCFFCEAAECVISPNKKGGCPTCPGCKLDPDFACQLEGKNWHCNPVEFYEYLKKIAERKYGVGKI